MTKISYRSVLLFALVIVVTVTMPSFSPADTLTLNDGQVIKGTFKGMEGSKYSFEAFGNTMEFEVNQVRSIQIGDQAPAAPAAQSPQASQGMGPVTVPGGTGLLVKMDTHIETGKSKKGDPFIATVEKAVIIGQRTVFPKGAKAYGKVVESVAAKRVAGRAKLIIQVIEVDTGSGTVSINTESLHFEGSGQGTLGKVAVGAGIGALADNKKGAQTGAGVGAVIAVLTPGNQIAVSRGTLLEFRILAPVEVK